MDEIEASEMIDRTRRLLPGSAVDREFVFTRYAP